MLGTIQEQFFLIHVTYVNTHTICHRVYIRVEHKGHVVQINKFKKITS
jgi:hypothetical protein